jgi:hypothetical protein
MLPRPVRNAAVTAQGRSPMEGQLILMLVPAEVSLI